MIRHSLALNSVTHTPHIALGCPHCGSHFAIAQVQTINLITVKKRPRKNEKIKMIGGRAASVSLFLSRLRHLQNVEQNMRMKYHKMCIKIIKIQKCSRRHQIRMHCMLTSHIGNNKLICSTNRIANAVIFFSFRFFFQIFCGQLIVVWRQFHIRVQLRSTAHNSIDGRIWMFR